jgi:hypothetical protein
MDNFRFAIRGKDIESMYQFARTHDANFKFVHVHEGMDIYTDIFREDCCIYDGLMTREEYLIFKLVVNTYPVAL